MAENESGNKKNWFVRHKLLTGIIVVIVLIVALSSASSETDTTSNNTSDSDATSETATEEAPAEAANAGLNEAVHDGQFEFVVKSLECGKEEVVHPETDAIRDQAQGQFCLLNLSVKNIGDEQQYFSDSDQKLLNSAGQEYSADSSATITLGGNSDAFFSQINPGNSVEGTLVFDIPKDQTPVVAELHDSAFSGGVKVDLQ